MGQDNSAKERQRKHLERKTGRRASYDRILIVCEGSKTEPNYFKEIRAAHRLQTANVEVQPGVMGTEPIQVVLYAQTLFEKGETANQRAMALAAKFNAYSEPEPYTAIAGLIGLLTRLHD